MHSTFKHGKGGASASYHAVEDGSLARPRRGFFQGWWWEMTAAVATLGCMAAVVYLLWRMQDRPADEWTADEWTFPITLNSTIAAFVTAAKSTALLILASCVGQSKWLHFQARPSRLQDLDTFDAASRGPSGALQLLWRLRMRFGSAIVAALVTIVALGVDFFAQQVVRLDQQIEMVDSGNATFWVTDKYTGGGVMRAMSGFNAVEASTVDTRMQGAIYRGLYNIPSSTPFNCSSECEWDGSHFSLGFVSECTNVTEEALKTTVLKKVAPNGGNGNTAILATPGNLTMTYNVSYTSYHTVIDLVGADLTPQKQEDPFLPEFTRIGVLQLKKGAAEAREYELGTNNTEVVECTLGFAAFEYVRVSASGSSLRIGERKMHRLSPGHFEKDEANRTWAVYNTTDLPVFRVATVDLAALGEFFAGPQFGGRTYDGEGPPPSSGLGPAFLAGRTAADGGVAAHLARVAQSMTDQLLAARADDDDQDEEDRRRPVAGRSARATVYVRVRWVWLAVPLLVSAAAVVLLVVAMARTAYAGTALWKSSALAVLYHDLVPAPGEQRYWLHTDVAGLEHLDELTKGVKVGYK